MKLALFLIGSVLLCACQQTPVQVEAVPVNAAYLRGHVEFLAADSLRGRDTGSRGYQVAADYVAAEFSKLGLQPAGLEGSYFQPVPLIEKRLVAGSARATLHLADGDLQLEYPQQFIMGPDALRAQTQLSAELVIVGYGIVPERYAYNDYEGLDAKGKIAVAINGRPKDWPTEEGAHLGSGFEKARHAAERGAVGRIVLHTPRTEKTFPYEQNFAHLDVPGMNWEGPAGLPNNFYPQLQAGAYFNLGAAAELFAGAPVSLEEIYQADMDGKPVAHFELPGKVSLARESAHRRFTSPNVVAVLEGSDPELKHEYMVYSAHLDHLGVIPGAAGEDEIYNGALDNAAGIATLLETARVLAAERGQLKRSVLFIAVTAEEKGMLGASYYAANPTLPIDSLVANVNLDMPLLLYPFADVVAFGAEHSDLKETVSKAAGLAGIELAADPMPEQALFVRSDHYQFVQKGVPSVFLVTGFTSRDAPPSGGEVYGGFLASHYHKPSDDLELPIDYQAGVLFTEVNINIGREICNTPRRPRWNEGDFFGDIFARGE